MKSVAVIGAGPAGLVATKTLLYSYPGAFEVTVFEQSTSLGGLWAVESNPEHGLINPEMNTNLSQFTVCFSDLAWDTLDLQPSPTTFPKAWQVNRYLEAYARKFIPDGVVILGARVRKAERIQLGWRITTTNLKSDEEKVEVFDYLIIASGLFSKPAPANFHFSPSTVPILHSSKFRKLQNLSITEQQLSRGKVLVVGGSHSGAEVAAGIALQMSDRCHSANGSGVEPLEVVHVAPYPILAIPPFVQPGNGSPPTFLPLDTLLNNLSSRKDDPISFMYGHPSAEKFKQRENLLGSLAHGARDGAERYTSKTEDNADSTRLKTSYAVVSDYYTKFVESGAITPILGRIDSIAHQKDSEQKVSGFARAKIRQGSDEVEIEGIAAVINATGFSPAPALSFLSEDVKERLGFDASFPRLPLLLNREASTSSNEAPNNLALIGFSYGSYWGILEAQARMIAHKWSLDKPTSLSHMSESDEKSTKLLIFMQELRSKMKNDPFSVAQNFFGDYAGLLEQCSRELDLQRVELRFGARDGMVSPARYIDRGCDKTEAEKTIEKIQRMTDASVNNNAFAARSAFVALLGKWTVDRKGSLQLDSLPLTGSFHPRHPSASDFDLEYLFILKRTTLEMHSGFTSTSDEVDRLVYRLRETENTIEVWDVLPLEQKASRAGKMLGKLEFGTATSQENNKWLSVTMNAFEMGKSTVYSFQFSGVQVSRFKVAVSSTAESVNAGHDLEFSR